jgi:hypothetical protein
MVSATETMTTAELIELCRQSPTVPLVPVAAAAFGFGANLSYDLAARGEFPVRVIKAGRKLRVASADLLASLGISADASPGGTAA